MIKFDGYPPSQYRDKTDHFVGDATGWSIPLKWVDGYEPYWLVGDSHVKPEEMVSRKWTHYYGPVYKQNDIQVIFQNLLDRMNKAYQANHNESIAYGRAYMDMITEVQKTEF